MKKIILKSFKVAILFFFLFSGYSQAQNYKSLHDFEVEDIFGEVFDFSELKGKKVMIVNTASRCGLTPQYEGLERLYQSHKESGFVVVGFPANNFMNQEPGTNEEIQTFCQENYGVSFPMMSKISVKGDDIHPVFQWLTQSELNGVENSSVSWNFQKYLVDEEGRLIKHFSPRTKPEHKDIVSWIEQQ